MMLTIRKTLAAAAFALFAGSTLAAAPAQAADAALTDSATQSTTEAPAKGTGDARSWR